jgi:hypothetical protein
VFDSHGTQRLIKWREFREQLEISSTPLEDVAIFWGRAPFVSPYIDSANPSSWPDPWHLILDDRYDDLAIALGMLYTLKLTRRFMNSHCEIHTSMLPKEKHPQYLLIVDKQSVLNFEYQSVVKIQDLTGMETNMIWSKDNNL